MVNKKRQPLSGQQPDRNGVDAPTAKRHESRNGHLFAATENSKPVIVLEGVTLQGILADMQQAYLTIPDRNTKDPASVRRWRRLFNERPDKFLAILADQEKRFREAQAAAQAQLAEFERLQAQVAELTAQNCELQTQLQEEEVKVARLTELVPGGVDPFDDPHVRNTSELARRLAEEYGGIK